MSQELLACVIEDNTPIRKLFCTLMKKHNFQTVDFPDGASALQWLQQGKPAVIIMDILLPDMNGTDLIKTVKLIPGMEKVPVIAVTGFASTLDQEKFLEMGFSSYISKPVNTSTFVNDIELVIKNNK